MTHSLSVDGRRQPAGDVAQRHVGDRGVEHLHERRNHHRQRDKPRIDRGGCGDAAVVMAGFDLATAIIRHVAFAAAATLDRVAVRCMRPAVFLQDTAADLPAFGPVGRLLDSRRTASPTGR